MHDIIIIGAGPAGISAGIYAVSRGKKDAGSGESAGGRTDRQSVDRDALHGA